MEDAFVVALLSTCRGTAVLGGLGAVGEAVASFAAFPGYGELVGIFSVFPQHLWKEPPARVNEPVAHLEKTTKKNVIHAVREPHHMAYLRSALQFKRKSAGMFIIPGADCTCEFNREIKLKG